jgi:uncharacterized membrane protein HdeD (DUF308 family)
MRLSSLRSSLTASRAGMDDVREHWKGVLVLGIVLILLGVAAIFFPFVATLATELTIAWILVFSGIAQGLHAFRLRHRVGFWPSLLSGLLTLAVGLLLILFPMSGILSITFLIAILFLANGAFPIAQALRLRPLEHRGLLLAGGVLSMLLGLLVIAQWPAAAVWLLGLLVGIDLMFSGWMLLWLSLTDGLPHRLWLMRCTERLA